MENDPAADLAVRTGLLHDMRATDQDQHRRERGRIAQSRFRKRQACAKRDLEAENRQLKEALCLIAQAAVGNDIFHNTTIQDAFAIAGIELGSRPGHRSHAQITRTPSYIEDTAILYPPSLPARLWRRSRDRDRPRLLPDPYQYLAKTTPPPDMLPFVGQGAYTFGGHIFWSVIEKSLYAIRDLDLLEPASTPKSLVTMRPRFGYHRIAERVTQETIPRITFLAALSEAQREYEDGMQDRLDDEWSRPPEPQAEPGQTTSSEWYSTLVEREKKSYEQSGRCMFLSIQDVEQRIRLVVGDNIFAVLTKAAVAGMGTTASKNNVVTGSLVTLLSDTFVCFGEGPRWESKLLDELLNEWVSSTTVAPPDVYLL